MFMKFYSGKHCWIATDVPTPADYIPNPALSPVQEIIISSLWFPSAITTMSNDDIMKDSSGFAHLELGHLGSAPQMSAPPMTSHTSVRWGTRTAKITSPRGCESYPFSMRHLNFKAEKKELNTIQYPIIILSHKLWEVTGMTWICWMFPLKIKIKQSSSLELNLRWKPVLYFIVGGVSKIPKS